MTEGTCAIGDHRLPLLSLPGGLSRLGGGAAGAAAGRSSFSFANEKQGEENLLRDVFSNLPYQPGVEPRCPHWQPSAVLGAQLGASRHPMGPCLGQEVTRRVAFQASTEETGLVVPHDVHHV